MPALVSTRFLLLVGESFPLRKLSKVPSFHGSVRFLSRYSLEEGPLTLASLGFRAEIRDTSNTKIIKSEVSKSKIRKASPLDRPLEVSKSKIRIASELDRPLEVSKSKIRIAGELDRPQELSKSNTFEPVIQLDRPIEVMKIKKVVKNNGVNEVESRKSLDVESAPLSAKSFSELGLPPLLIERLEREGFKVPTDVQSAAIPTILKDHDVVIQSYTGSGKTLAYLLPILSEVGPLKRRSADGERVVSRKHDIQAVIVAPSRELGMQIVREFEKLLGPGDKKMVQQLVGGANRSRQEEALKKNKPAIVVGTPGRIAEISAAGKLNTHDCRFLVLDEVDELLSFNFRESMHRILEHVGRKAGADRPNSNPNTPIAKRPERQTVMVSATVPFSVIRAARSWGRDPLLVQAKRVVPIDSVLPSGPIDSSGPTPNNPNMQQTQGAIESLPPALKHYYCVSKLQHKIDTLRRCVHALDAKSVIAFMNHSKQLKDAVFKLEARGMSAIELHGDLGKLERSTTMKKFKNGDARVLVTNELSARGLDVPECDLVVNLGIPTDSIHYAHRAGRTGRLGRKGSVVTICEESEVFIMKKMQRQLNVPINACEFTDGNLVVSEDKFAEAAKQQ